MAILKKWKAANVNLHPLQPELPHFCFDLLAISISQVLGWLKNYYFLQVFWAVSWLPLDLLGH
jgi:hypothetical protein